MSDSYVFCGTSRTSNECLRYAEIHGCPSCGAHEAENSRLTTAIDASNGKFTHFYRISCANCMHVRCLSFWYDRDAEAQRSAEENKAYKAHGILQYSYAAKPESLHRTVLALIFGPMEMPSSIITPTEWAQPIEHWNLARPASLAELDNDDFSDAYVEINEALINAYELRKFSDPAPYTREWVEEQIVGFERDRDEAVAQERLRRDLPATDPRSEHYPRTRVARPMLAPLTRGSVVLHEAWLAGKGGEALVARKVDAAGAKFLARNLSRAVVEDCVLDDADFTGSTIEDATFTRVRLARANFTRTSLAGSTFTGCDFRGADLTGVDRTVATFTDCSFD